MIQRSVVFGVAPHVILPQDAHKWLFQLCTLSTVSQCRFGLGLIYGRVGVRFRIWVEIMAVFINRKSDIPQPHSGRRKMLSIICTKTDYRSLINPPTSPGAANLTFYSFSNVKVVLPNRESHAACVMFSVGKMRFY